METPMYVTAARYLNLDRHGIVLDSIPECELPDEYAEKFDAKQKSPTWSRPSSSEPEHHFFRLIPS